MKAKKLLIILIGIFVFFNSFVYGKEKPVKDEKSMTESSYNVPEKETIYVDNMFQFILVSRIIDKTKELFPEEFKNVEIIIEFGEESIESAIEIEDWMTKPFVIEEQPLIEEELTLDNWMLNPFSI